MGRPMAVVPSLVHSFHFEDWQIEGHRDTGAYFQDEHHLGSHKTEARAGQRPTEHVMSLGMDKHAVVVAKEISAKLTLIIACDEDLQSAVLVVADEHGAHELWTGRFGCFAEDGMELVHDGEEYSGSRLSDSAEILMTELS
jgi:hypothetical protein